MASPMKTLTRSMLAASMLLFTASGCGDDAPPPKAVAKAKPPPEVAPVAAVSTVPSVDYLYNPGGKRDPFRAPDMVAAKSTEPEACSMPLCEYDVGQLNLVAVVTGGPNPLAMLQDPMGRGFNVRRNTQVGTKGGKVTAIRRDEVVITEFWTDPKGEKQPSVVSIQLRPETEQTPVVDLVTGARYQ